MTNPEVLKTIPIFVQDQLLTHVDLMNLVSYVEFQSQSIRLRQVGAGIICGLKPVWRDSTLTITAGSGVSSEGFPIQLDEMNFGYYEPKKIARSAFNAQSDSTEVLDVLELLEHGQALDGTLLSDMVVVLLLDIKYTPVKKLCADGCDQRGGERELNLRKLLLPRDTAQSLLLENYGQSNIDDLRALFQKKFQLDDLYCERLTSLPKIKSFDLLNTHYRAILDSAAKRVGLALKRAHGMFSEIFSQFVPRPDASFELPIDRFSPANPLDLQYLYDHLSDLILGYEEFRKVAFDLMDVCEVKSAWFPKHLFLGAILADEAELPIPADYARTPYFQPPIYNDNHIRVDAAKLLYERLSLLINNFRIPTATDVDGIRITPSKFGDAALSQRAIPFYYEPNTLHKHWNSDRSRKGKSHQVHSYHRIKLPPDSESNPPFDDPLVYDFEEYNFFRIEGHLGLEVEGVLKQVRELRDDNNLPFDIVSLRFASNDENQVQRDLFNVFASKHPGLEHKAGVPRGGTFIVVSENQKVVADFCLPYKYNPELLRPIILLERTTFCSNDDRSYKFTLSPSGGELEGKGTSQDDSTFTPKKTGVTNGTIDVTYTVDGVAAKLLLKILQVPEADFSIIPLPATAGMCNFQIKGIKPSQNEDDYEYLYTWSAGSERLVNSDDFVLQIPKALLEQQESFVLTLVVSNGPCRSKPVVNKSDIKRNEEDPDVDNPLNDPIDLTDNTRTLLKQRTEERLAILTALAAQNEGLAAKSSFQAVQGMNTSLIDTPIEELIEVYRESLVMIKLAYRNSQEPTLKAAYGKLIATATTNLLDALVSKQSKSSVRGSVVEQFAKLRKLPMDMESLWQAWNSQEILDNFGAERTKAIDSLLPPVEAPPT